MQILERRTLLSSSPTLDWSRYLGGTGLDEGYAIALDSSGNAFVTGKTSSTDIGNNNYNGGVSDAFVAKVNADGSLAWFQYLGGSGGDEGYAIAVDSGGNAWVTGYTASSGWTSDGFDTSYNGTYDAFVAQVGSNDGAVVWSSYLGGSRRDEGHGIAIDDYGNILLTGFTTSDDFAGGVNNYHGTVAYYDAFVAKIDADSRTLFWSSYLGGTGDDFGLGIALDGDGNAFVTGKSNSTNWENIVSDADYGGSGDGFVAKVNTYGTLLWSRPLGGSNYDYASAIAVDGNGDAWVTGYTASYPVYPPTSNWMEGGFDIIPNGGSDAFVAKLNTDGGLAWSSYLGGNVYEGGTGIAIDGGGNAWVTGFTTSSNWAEGGFDTSQNGSYDGYVARINADGSSRLDELSRRNRLGWWSGDCDR